MKFIAFILSFFVCCVAEAQLTNISTGQNIGTGSNVANVATGGGGGVTATDNFQRADANPISNPMSDSVSTWISHPGDWDNLLIASQICKGASGNWGAAKVSSPSFSANQKTSITISTLLDVGPGVRMQSGGSGYTLVVANSSSIVFYKVTDSGGLSFSSLGSVSVSLSTGDILSLEIFGSTLTARVNGISVGTQTDSTFASGQPFVAAQNDGNISAISATDL